MHTPQPDLRLEIRHRLSKHKMVNLGGWESNPDLLCAVIITCIYISMPTQMQIFIFLWSNLKIVFFRNDLIQ